MDTPRGGPQVHRRSQAPQVPGSELSLQERFPVTQALPFLVTDCPRDWWKLSVLSPSKLVKLASHSRESPKLPGMVAGTPDRSPMLTFTIHGNTQG